MPLGIYPRTKEQYEKIGKINSIKMKEYWRNNKATQKQIDAITKTSIRKKESFGYVNSSEARKKLSQTWKKKWANGEVSQKQKDNFLIKCRGVRKGMKDSEQHKLNIGIKNKEHRKNQIFPKQDTSIEIKIQDYLKQLGFNFFIYINI